jgi:predicted glycosyltransferase
MPARTDVLIHVQHLLGIGHLQRAARLAAGAAGAGLDTVLASGGRPVPHLDAGGAELVQLPAAASADAQFSGLLDADGTPVDDAWKARRRDAALELLRARHPRVLLLELFPFGRRSFRFELIPLLEAAHALEPRPWVLVSLRDLLNAPAPAKADWAVEVTERFVDRVLVHGDPGLARLEESFPAAARIAARLVYTGYVAPPAPPHAAANGEVLVSTGGGAVGYELAAAALGARARSHRLAEATWRVLLGHNLPEPQFQALAARAGPGTVVERGRSDFQALLGGCRVSVSQAGYNTVVELLRAGRPGVLVPFEAGGREREQALRASRLAGRGLAEHLPEAELAPDTLAAAVDRAADGVCADDHRLDLDGVANSAQILGRLAARLPAPGAAAGGTA